MLSSEERRDARDQIADLMFAYAEGIDQGDQVAVGKLFERGVWEVTPEQTLSTPDEVTAYIRKVNRLYEGGRPSTRHVTTNIRVDIADDGKTAKARAYVILFQVTPEFPLQPIFQGRYQDEFAQENGTWYFTKRAIEVDGIGDMSAHLVDAGLFA
jgi:3-phenylpropionate/cinnamic acid dioxygenase small subunit